MRADPGTPFTLTALFTDIEASTRLWDEYPGLASDALDQHDRLIDEAVTAHGGRVFQHTGDGFIARFDAPTAAVRAAVDAQRRLRDADWGPLGALKVRMGVHCGEVVERPEGLFGWALNFCSRLSDVGHGGQVLLSEAVYEQVETADLDGITIRDLGAFRLRDVPGATRIFQAVVPDLTADFPPPRKTISATRPIPRYGNAFVGRERELAELEAAVANSGLVTITGIPGVGTTRVAVELARRLADRADGPEVLWCNLAGIGGEDVVASIMTTHSITSRPGATALDSLAAWLSEHEAVMVLDQCEECLGEVRALVSTIAASGSKAGLVVTSRHVVGTGNEFVVRLAPLPANEGVDLLLERSAAAGSAPIDRPLAAEIVALIDVLPFAIEVAAARLVTFSPVDVRDALASGGLSAVRADSRGRAVEQAVELAIEALPPELQRMLIAATVFGGAFDAAAFNAVCSPDTVSDLPNALIELVDASLVQPITDDQRSSFRLLEPVRAVVVRRATPEALSIAHDRLREHVLAFSRQSAAELRGSSEQRWLRALGRQFDVIRGVFNRAVEAGDVDTAVALCTDHWEWAFFRFNDEYFDWGRWVLDRFDDPADPRMAAVHGVVALGHWFSDEFDLTLQHGHEALRRERELGAPFSLPARLALINATVFAGADAPPADVFHETEEYQRRRPEGYYRMNVEAQNAIMATWFGQYDIAEGRALKALKIARESGNPTSIAYSLWALGQAIEQDDPDWAEHLFADALQHARDVDNRWIVTLVQLSLASSRRRTSGPIAAAGLLDDLLVQLMRAAHWAQVWNAVRLVALVAADVGDDELAFQLAAAADAAEMTFPALPADNAALAAFMARVTEERGPTWSRRTARIAATLGPTEAAQAALAGIGRVIADAT